MSEPPSPDRETGRCPICGRAREAKFRPFCSGRCADIDLARWLKGTYAIPARETDEEAGSSGHDGEA